jgi:hypothetical protein
MSNTSITYLIAAIVGVASIALWVWLIVVPAWTSFSRGWERVVSLVLSVYVLAALLGLGGGIGALLLYYYDEL